MISKGNVVQTTNKGRVLVTGATGFIGARLAEMLLQQGFEVRVLVRRPNALAGGLAACEVVQGDLSDTEALGRAVRDVEVIYHCAANVATWDSAENYQATNVAGLRNLLEQVVQHNPGLRRFMHFSTVDVYGFPDEPCDEQCETRPSRFAYGESKRQGELALRGVAAQHGLPFTILRPCNVIGPGSQFVERIGTELQNGLMMRVDGGKANAGLLFVDNLVRYAMCLAQTSEAVGGIFNVRDPYDVSWKQFLGDLKSGIGGRGTTLNLPFWLAEASAGLLGGLFAIAKSNREPLLHPLIVRLFGRTCGHSAQKLHQVCPLDDAVGYQTALQRSCDWFRERSATSA